jgi:hypothetical protein
MASQTKMEAIDINNINGNYDVEAAVVQAEPSDNDNTSTITQEVAAVPPLFFILNVF